MGAHHRPHQSRWSSTRGGGLYRAQHGLALARSGLSRAQLRARRHIGRARSRARHGVSEAGHRLARAGRRRLSRRSQPSPVEALLPWGVVLVGVGVMIGLLISAFVVPVGYTTRLDLPDLDFAHPSGPSTETDDPDGDEKGAYALRDVAEIQYSPTPAPPSPSPSRSQPPAPEPAPEPEPEPSGPSVDPYLAGTYRVEEAYHDVFIGNVVIANNSVDSRDWTVELAFGRDVGKLNTFWVDGTPQPTLQRAGDRYVFSSTVPVPGRSWVILKVHLDRYGHDIHPTTCTVNGADCSIAGW